MINLICKAELYVCIFLNKLYYYHTYLKHNCYGSTRTGTPDNQHFYTQANQSSWKVRVVCDWLWDTWHPKLFGYLILETTSSRFQECLFEIKWDDVLGKKQFPNFLGVGFSGIKMKMGASCIQYPYAPHEYFICPKWKLGKWKRNGLRAIELIGTARLDLVPQDPSSL